MSVIRATVCLLAAIVLAGCASTRRPPPGHPPALATDFAGQVVQQRTWAPPAELGFDPIRLSEVVPLSPLPAEVHLLGPKPDDAIASLAAKLAMIEDARHSIDLVYYIFHRDEAGYAMLGALCEAVQRGVDIRMMIDSVGSLGLHHRELRGLQSCAEQAGEIVDTEGRGTGHRARVQVAIINPLSSPFVRWNRRSHDKLLVVDGHQGRQARLITGGRNIALDYYGVTSEGAPDPHAYLDAELLVRGVDAPGMSIGDAATYYYTLLFLQPGNRLLDPPRRGSRAAARERERAVATLATVRAWPRMQAAMHGLAGRYERGFLRADLRLAHELGNLANVQAVRGVGAHMEANRNSIQRQWIELNTVDPPSHLRIVSPYFFFAQYRRGHRDQPYDGATMLLDLLRKNPDMRIELLTNSALSTDNPLAQAVIDMETAPRLLLSEDDRDAWRRQSSRTELAALARDAEWQALIDNPQVTVYQLGGLDADLLGGDVAYGKLHAKFIIADERGFIGTDNFDYRSRLFNNEFGFFFESPALSQALVGEFEALKARSLRWGSADWLTMRQRLIEAGGARAWTTRWQRPIHGISRVTGLHWLY